MMDMPGTASPPDFQYSDESEGSELRDLVDRQLPHLPPEDPSVTSPSPVSDYRSSGSNVYPPSHDRRRRSHRKDRDSRHSLANREVVKLVRDEELELKKMRRLLREALDRLSNETQRAQEAERRALEIAGRFRVVNDARVQAQTELNRTAEELRLYKMQFENAQREIQRGQDILKDLEAQRNDAEAAAARARTTARKFKEEHIMHMAREEGRAQGYEEGMKRGLEEGRASGYNRGHSDMRDDVMDDIGDLRDGGMGDMRTDPLDGLQIQNLPSPTGDQDTLSSPPRNIPPPQNDGGAQGSRFRENDMTPNTTPTPRFIRPIPIHNAPPSPSHPATPIPPDGWIPAANGNFIPIPPPHEMQQPPPSPHTPSQPLPIPMPVPSPIPPVTVHTVQVPNDPVFRDYGYSGSQGRLSPGSLAESVPSISTTVSQFELVKPHPSSTRSSSRNYVREKDIKPPGVLDVIHEVSSSMEYSPGKDSRGMPEPVTFPTTSTDGWGGEISSQARSTPRSRTTSQRLADELRYSDPEAIDEWRKSMSDELRSVPSKPNIRRASNLTTPTPLAPSPLGLGETGSSSRPRSSASNRPRSPVGARSMSPGLNTLGVPSNSRSRLSNILSDAGSPRQLSPLANNSGDISIHIEPPSAPESNNSPAQGENLSMLSPNLKHSHLPSQPPPMVPTVPNSPAMRQPSMGMLPTEPVAAPLPPGGFPPNFVPISPMPPFPVSVGASRAPPSPGPSIYGGMQAPYAVPRQRTSSSSSSGLYAPNPNVPNIPGIQRPSSSTSSLGHGLPKAVSSKSSKHSRAQSYGGMSTESLQPNTQNGAGLRPPSAMSGSIRSTTPSRPQYEEAPLPSDVKYPDPPFIQAGGRNDLAPPSPLSTSSRLSGAGHQRSLSLNAGMTPGTSTHPLSNHPPPQLRRVPSAGSASGESGISRRSASVSHYDPSTYVDPAFLASDENLLANVQSPTTAANTKANATAGGAGMGIPYNGSRGPPNITPASLPRRKRR